MKEYVVTQGPLRSFDHLYDPRLDKFEGLGAFPAIGISQKRLQGDALATYRRDPAGEFAFLRTLFAPLLKGHTAYYAFRDVERSVGYRLTRLLKSQNKIRWSGLKYWTSDDDLLLCELKDFHEDMDFVRQHYPPSEGATLFYLMKQPFDVFDIWWQRRVRVAGKFREDPFHYDAFACARDALVTLHCDNEGTFTVVHQPEALEEAVLQRKITEAGLKAQMEITFAPGLFG